jgi:hypothetical protein
MTVTVCWYYPTRRVEEKVPAAMSEAQAIEMLSGHQDFDRFIEEYRRMDAHRPDFVQALILKREAFYTEHQRGQSTGQERALLILASYPRLRK